MTIAEEPCPQPRQLWNASIPDYESAVHFFAEAADEAPGTEILNDLGYAQQTCGHLIEATRRTAVRRIIADSELQPNLLSSATHRHVLGPQHEVQ